DTIRCRNRTGVQTCALPISAPDVVGAVSFQRPRKQTPDNGSRFLVNQQVVFVLRVFLVAEGGKAAGKLAFLRFQQIRGMNLLGEIGRAPGSGRMSSTGDLV